MIFGIDYDHTWTRAPALFRAFLQLVLDHGGTAVIVTARDEDLDPIPEVLPLPIVYAGGRPKRLAAKLAGHDVSIWIDDYPHLVDFGIGHRATRTMGLP